MVGIPSARRPRDFFAGKEVKRRKQVERTQHGHVAATARRRLSLYVRPTLLAALEARARRSGLDLDVEVREILEQAIRPPRPIRTRPTALHAERRTRLRIVPPDEDAS